MFLLLVSCTTTTKNITPAPLEYKKQNTTFQLPDDAELKAWAYQINQFYMADAETVILPYINLIRSFDEVREDEYCSRENNEKITSALKLNPSSLFAYIQLNSCSYQAGNETEADKYLENVQSIAEALLKESSGEDAAEAIEVRELDEAHIILELSGLQPLDLEIIQNEDDFVYKFHVYDTEVSKFEYRYFKNSKLLKVMYGSLSGKTLTTKQTTAISLKTYTQQKLSAALIPIARQQLVTNKFQEAIDLLSPLPKESGIVITLLAEAYLRAGNTDEFYNLLETLELLSNNGLIDTKVLLAQFIQTYAEQDDEFEEVDVILQDIDNLTSSGTGALLLAKKLSTYENSVELISEWLEKSNDLAYWNLLPSIAEYIHHINGGNHNTEYELLLLSAEESNSQSLYELAKLFKNGHLVEKNNEKTIELYRTSAELGNASAQLDLGYYYETGSLGLKKDNDIAFEWYSKSAEQSHAIALSNLANFYEHGKAVEQNLDIAIKYYNKAIEGGYDHAFCNLGNIYRDYENIFDIEKALSIYKKGANKGLSECQFNVGYTYDDFLNSPEEALKWYQKAASMNHSAAINNLGYMYGRGFGVEIDLKKEFEYTLKAANLGNATAQNNLGRSYEYGTETKQDYVKAHEYYTKAAMQNHGGALTNLGLFYSKGIVVEKNRSKALELYKKAAAMGDYASAFNLGNAYLNGDGVEKDRGTAIQYYQQSAKSGYDKANCQIGKIYREQNEIDTAIRYFSLGAEKGLSTCEWELGFTFDETLNNYKQAIHWYESAANKNNRDAYHSLGLVYYNGKGVNQDYAKAFKYYQLAANLGEPTSHANLGFMYESGKGVSADNEMAFKHYEKAAEQDDAQGLNNLATFYLHGIVAKQDKKKAISLYKRAAELDNDFALNNLGKAYRDGTGVEVDHKVALDYFEKAAILGFSEAIEAAGVMYHLGHGTQVSHSKAIKYLAQTSTQGFAVSSYYLGEIFLTAEKQVRDINKAIKYFTISSEQGDIDAPYDLGEIYRTDEFVPTNIEKAIYWHSKSVALNNTNSLPILASIYWTASNDETRDPDQAIKLLTQYATFEKMDPNFYIGQFFHFGQYENQDYNLAREYYEKGVQVGNRGATNNLAELYRLGLGGETDYKSALSLYNQAVELGSLHALFNLGEMYRDGHGVEVNMEKALDWFLQAADKGFLDAMYQVAMMYQKGVGTDINLSLANTWLVKASDKGYFAAKLALGKNLIAGNGIPKDENYGIELIKESAEKGFEPAIKYMSLQQ